MRQLAFAATLVALFSAAAHAHTHLLRSNPADGSVSATAPANVSLEFAEPVRITALTLQKPDGKTEPLTPVPQDAAAKITVPAPQLAPGAYTLNWRAVADDKHIMSGKIQFTIGSAKAGDPAAHH